MQEILVGTAKGLLVYTKKDKEWAVKKVHFLGFPVAFLFVDERTGTWWVGLAHRHWGPKLHRSFDRGNSWEEMPLPKYPKDAKLSKGKPALMKKMWCMQQAGADRPGGLWLGTEPGGLFYSADQGEHFELVRSLWNHPSRQDSMQWFGAGRDYPFIHSIVVDPGNSAHLYIAVSCAGVFETKDGGASWSPRNQGLVAAYLPNPSVEVGHDPHLLLQSHKDPKVLWQQNHCGVFRTTDGGAQWQNISDQEGLAGYGFALAIDPDTTDRAWVIPAISDEMRVAKDLALVVSRTQDGGQTWEAQRNGLPQEHSFDIVYRHSLVYRSGLLVFGTNNGNIYLSDSGGASWQQLAGNLPRVDAVVIA
ncbi:MAG TPA: hypothetical protein VJ953_18875 [Saprospiraceae bacterium]|nr:hypothetical protein [Saprospiraceae bacterium]